MFRGLSRTNHPDVRAQKPDGLLNGQRCPPTRAAAPECGDLSSEGTYTDESRDCT